MQAAAVHAAAAVHENQKPQKPRLACPSPLVMAPRAISAAIREPLPIRDTDSCSATMAVSTVSYAFVTRGVLPLWPLWRRYFEGCGGSAVPIFHSQDNETHASIREAAAPYGGYVLPPSETIAGNPRFSWRMVAMMMRLYYRARGTQALNGCAPRWVITLSERCAPVQTCDVVHAALASRPGVNRIQAQLNEQYEKSQWTALWLADAAEVATEETILQAYWEPRIWNHGYTVQLPATNQTHHRESSTASAPDEIIIPFEIRERRHAIADHGPTFVCWHCEGWGGVAADGHAAWTSPSAFVTFESSISICQRARSRGYWFVRKIGDGSLASSAEVMEGIISAQCLNLTRVAMGDELDPHPIRHSYHDCWWHCQGGGVLGDACPKYCGAIGACCRQEESHSELCAYSNADGSIAGKRGCKGKHCCVVGNYPSPAPPFAPPPQAPPPPSRPPHKPPLPPPPGAPPPPRPPPSPSLPPQSPRPSPPVPTHPVPPGPPPLPLPPSPPIAPPLPAPSGKQLTRQ